MISYNELSQNADKFLAMTCHTIEEFEALVPYFQAEFEDYVKAKTLDGKPRIRRRHTKYKNSPLPNIEDKLLFILIYLKQGPTQEMQATLYGMHQPDANQWIHLLHPLLNQALAKLGELPARDADSLEFEEGDVAVYMQDGVERAIPRPKNPDAQKEYYSGKKNNTPSRILSSAMASAKSFS